MTLFGTTHDVLCIRVNENIVINRTLFKSAFDFMSRTVIIRLNLKLGDEASIPLQNGDGFRNHVFHDIFRW